MIKTISVLGAVLLLAVANGKASADTQRAIPHTMLASVAESSWTGTNPGLLVASDRESYQAILDRLSNRESPGPDSFDAGYHYFFVFAGQTMAGPGHIIGLNEIFRQSPADSGIGARPGGRNTLTIYLDLDVRKGQIRIVRSPMIVFRVKKSSINSPINPETRMELLVRRIQRENIVAGEVSEAPLRRNSD